MSTPPNSNSTSSPETPASAPRRSRRSEEGILPEQEDPLTPEEAQELFNNPHWDIQLDRPLRSQLNSARSLSKEV